MFRFLALAWIVFTTAACSGPRYVDYFPYHDDGTPKPKVALLPMADSSQGELAWSVSDELTNGIYYRLRDSGQIFVPTPAEVGPVWANIGKIDFFGNDLSFTREFRNTDFIVAMELIEHTTTPCKVEKPLVPCITENRSLATRVRIRIIDIRCDTPKVVLYEVFKSCYQLTPAKGGINCDMITWKCEGYHNTPCGIAHDRLIRSLTARIEEVVWSAK